MTIHTGRHFLQIPGPTNVPDRVLRAMDRPVIDHRGLEFAQLGAEVLDGVKSIFKTKGPCRDLSRLRLRGMGSGNCEHAFSGRPRSDV